MFFLRLIKLAVERLVGVRVYRVLPRGIDPLYDLQRLIPTWQPHIIFDVGANTGQSVVRYAKRFPYARIFSFEPCRQTFTLLRQNVGQFSNVECLALALAASGGKRILKHGQKSDLHRLVTDDAPSGQQLENNEAEIVEAQTIDHFCHERKVDVIETELGFCPDNDVHVPFQEVRVYLEERSYFIFGFYEQTREWKFRKAHLRRSNVVFISQELDLLRT